MSKKTLLLAAGLALVGCDFSKQPYLFSGLGDGAPIGLPDRAFEPDAGSEDAADPDAGGPEDSGGAPDSGEPGDSGVLADSGLPADTGVFLAGAALELSAVEQGLSGAGAGTLPCQDAPRTFEAWIRGAAAPRSGRLFQYGTPARSFDVLLIVTGGEGKLIVVDGFDGVQSAPAAALAEDAWHHVAVVLTATTPPDGRLGVRFYLDGALLSATTKDPNDVACADAQRLIVGGVAADPIGFARAQLDELRLWSVARSEAEIALNRRLVLTQAPGLVGYWAMNERGAGAGIAVPNAAVVTATAAAPALSTVGGAQFVPSSAF